MKQKRVVGVGDFPVQFAPESSASRGTYSPGYLEGFVLLHWYKAQMLSFCFSLPSLSSFIYLAIFTSLFTGLVPFALEGFLSSGFLTYSSFPWFLCSLAVNSTFMLLPPPSLRVLSHSGCHAGPGAVFMLQRTEEPRQSQHRMSSMAAQI